MIYKIEFSDGEKRITATYPEALGLVYARYPEGYAVDDDNGRTLVWPNQAASTNDDGRRAVASIRAAQ